MGKIIIISGSPSANSRSDKVLGYLGKLLEKQKYLVNYISVKDVSQEDLFHGRFDSPDVDRISKLLKGADGVIIGSPVYKAAYSGVLKALIDILPQDILEHKPVLPLMTGGSPSHLLALEYTFKPLLATLKGHNLKGVYLLDCQIDKEKINPIIDEKVLERTTKQLQYLVETVEGNALPVGR